MNASGTDGSLVEEKPIGEPRAGGAPARPRTDRFLRSLARLLITVFYRKVEVIGQDKIPTSGGAIVVGNHVNSLVDGVLLLAFLPRIPRFLAASTVFDIKPLAPIFTAAGVVPLYRRQDGNQKEGDTAKSMTAAADLLAAGGVLAVFPEGKSHNDPALLPIKSGTARIALDAERTHGPLDLKVIPVGMIFEAKFKFRSRALIQVGDPIEVDPNHLMQGDHSAAAPQMTKQLTDQIAKSLTAVTANYATWDEAVIIEQAADMWLQSSLTGTEIPDIAETEANRAIFRQGYIALRESHPSEVRKLRNGLTEYVRLLEKWDLRDEHIAARYPKRAVFRSLGPSLKSLLTKYPFAAIGMLVNFVPYYALRIISQRQALDKRAAWSIFAGLFLFPAFWVATALIAGIAANNVAGPMVGLALAVVLLVLAPMSGLYALRTREARKRASRNFRAWHLLRVRKDIRPTLIEKRAQLISQLSSMWEVFFGISGD